jgi:hypothetical protein
VRLVGGDEGLGSRDGGSTRALPLDALEHVHPETIALYRTLTRRRVATSRQPGLL